MMRWFLAAAAVGFRIARPELATSPHIYELVPVMSASYFHAMLDAFFKRHIDDAVYRMKFEEYDEGLNLQSSTHYADGCRKSDDC